MTPGGMRRGGEGFAYTVRVRVIHAHVRRGLRLAGKWDEGRWGAPIPQPFMAFTMAEFGHIALDGMAQLGVRFTDDELAGIYHLWRYVGHIVGMDEQLSPRDEADHRRIEELYRLTSPGPSADDIAFTAALTDDYLIPELAAALPGPAPLTRPLAGELVRALQNVFLGEQTAAELGIARSRLAPVVRLANPLMAAAGRVRPVMLGGRDRLIRRSYRLRDAELDRMRHDYGVTHQMVDDDPRAARSAQQSGGDCRAEIPARF